MFKNLFAVLVCLLVFNGFALAQSETFWTVDYARAKDGQYENYVEFLKQNWVKARVEAKRRKYIKSFHLLVLPPDAKVGYDFVLLTEYADKKQFDAKEENFKKVFAKIGFTPIKGVETRDLFEIVAANDSTAPVWANPK